MVTKFKKGDRVRIADRTYYNRNFRGKAATVTDDLVYNTTSDVTVKPDGWGYSGLVSKKDLTLIDPKEDTFEVSRTDLEALEQALQRGDQGVQAQATLDKYLHPTVSKTFTVTIESPVEQPGLHVETVRSALVYGLPRQNKIKVEEQ